ncbi:MAG: phosphoenolpyruvate--protein phosphotransferase, partial [Lentisphaeria bacterium]
EAELKLFDEAVEYAKDETMRLEKEASRVLTESNAAIFYSHFLILEDKQLLDTVKALICEGYITRFALKTTLDQLRTKFTKIESESIRERLADITDVILRIIHSVSHILQGRKCSKKNLFKDVEDGERLIIIAHELYPSQLISWPLYKMAGIICETGGMTSHVAIIAKALKIPTLMGVKNASKEIKQRDNLLLDCHASNCYVNPTDDLLATFATSLKLHKNANQKTLPEAELSQYTTDGTSVNLYANLSLVSEIPLLKQYGANGIGLYRSEFVFMVRTAQPTIKEQHLVFQKFAEECHDQNFTLRLLDIGGDKPVSYLNFENETNPLLGVRGLRFLLRNPRLFKAHIEAILLTTVETTIKILIPMVTTVDELMLCKSIISQVQERMEKRNHRKYDNYQIGVMIETPSIIWDLDKLMPLVDFISVGTNDLIQYSYAVDRNNSTAIGNFYGANPATIRFLKHIVDVTSKYPDKPLTICGEMGSDINIVPLLLGIGFRSFSMSPWLIPNIRNLVKKVSIKECEKLVDKYINLNRQDEATILINSFIKKHDLKAIDTQ